MQMQQKQKKYCKGTSWTQKQFSKSLASKALLSNGPYKEQHLVVFVAPSWIN